MKRGNSFHPWISEVDSSVFKAAQSHRSKYGPHSKITTKMVKSVDPGYEPSQQNLNYLQN